jgi:hypothetical protein
MLGPMLLRRSTLLVLSLVASCVEEPAREGTPTDLAPKLEPGVVETVNRTITATRAATATATSTSAAVPDEPPDEPDLDPAELAKPIKKPKCKKAKPWITSPVCVKEDWAYAVGAVAKIRNPSLAKDAATNRARAAILSKQKGLNAKRNRLEGSEGVAFDTCKDMTYALVRAPVEQLGKPDLPHCGAAVMAR